MAAQDRIIDGRFERRTPEGIVLSLVPAGPAPRLWAWMLDTTIWISVYFVLLVVLFAGGANGTGGGLQLLFLFALWWGYPIVWEALGGRTPGKRALGLRVVRLDGLPVGWREAFVRGLLLAADFLPVFYASGLAAMLLVPGFRRLGDLAAGTLVIHDETSRAASEPAVAACVGAETCPFHLLPADQRALLDLDERSRRIPAERLHELGDLAEPLTGLRGDASVVRLRAWAAGLRT